MPQRDYNYLVASVQLQSTTTTPIGTLGHFCRIGGYWYVRRRCMHGEFRALGAMGEVQDQTATASTTTTLTTTNHHP